MDPSTKYKPIEVTTHNIYFHEESPILSIDCYNGTIVTSSYDNAIRLWSLGFKDMKYRDSVYKTAINSSIGIEFCEEIEGFSKPVNCVRFHKTGLNGSYLLAGCSDGGRVVVFH